MKKTMLWIGICLLVFAMGSPGVLAGDKLLVVAEQYAPFEFEMDGMVGGFDVDVAKRVFDKLNIDFEVRVLPWEEAWGMIEKGQADAVFSTSRKEKRKPFLYYPKEDMWTSEFVFFVRNDKKQQSFTGYADAKILTVGVVSGNSYDDGFWKAGLTTNESADINGCFRKLLDGTVDLVPADRIVGSYSLKLLGFQDKISPYRFVLFSKGYPMPFAKKSSYPGLEQIAKDFEAGLKELKASGEYDKILGDWISVF